MTNTVKAPDIGVVKSAAKAIRASLYETTKISHSKALEISSNAFGFTSYHACRKHFERSRNGFFDESSDKFAYPPHEFSNDIMKITGMLVDCDLKFKFGGITQSALSSIRSYDLMMVPLFALGAMGSCEPEFKEFVLSDDSRLNLETNEIIDGENGRMYFFGNRDAKRTINVDSYNAAIFIESALEMVRDISVDGVVNLKRMCSLALNKCEENSICVSEDLAMSICQNSQLLIDARLFLEGDTYETTTTTLM
jgi:hypothetical protein